MKRIVPLALLVFAVSCSGTGDTYKPIIDKPNEKYEQDLAECQALAKQLKYTNGDTKTAILTTGILGAGFGFIFGRDLASVAIGTAGGAGVGALSSVTDIKDQKKQIIIQCLRGRGHNVIL